MLLLFFYLLIGIFFIRTVSFAIYCRKNKQRGAIPLFVLSVCLLISPIISLVINRWL